MRRRLISIAFVLVSLALLGAGDCGSDVGDKGLGEACTRDSECADNLLCIGGECTAPSDGGADGAVDGG